MKRRQFLVLPGSMLLLFPLSKGALVLAEGEPDGVLTGEETEVLERFIFLLFPHENISKKPYLTVVQVIQAQASTQQVLEQLRAGINALNTARGGRWLNLSEQEQIRVMKEIEREPIFLMLYNDSLTGIYQNEELWRAIGYQGSSVEYGGYLHRGFDDINWLPEN